MLCRSVWLARFSLVFAIVVVGSGSSSAVASVTANIRVHSDHLKLGSLLLRDVSITVHTRNGAADTCITAALERARLRACGTLIERNDQVIVRNGRATLVIPTRTGADGSTLAPTTITSKVSGNLSKLDLQLRGTATTALVDLRTTMARAMLRDLSLPFDVRVRRGVEGELTITETSPLLVQVGSTTLSAAGASLPATPKITLHPGWPAWRLDIAWSSVPFGRALATASRGRISGTGTLDGELAFRGNRTDIELARGFAYARGGQLQVTDRALRQSLVASLKDPLAIKDRIAATLADFAYSSLLMTFGPNPLVQVAIRGRGMRVKQDVYLTINLRSQP